MNRLERLTIAAVLLAIAVGLYGRWRAHSDCEAYGGVLVASAWPTRRTFACPRLFSRR